MENEKRELGNVSYVRHFFLFLCLYVVSCSFCLSSLYYSFFPPFQPCHFFLLPLFVSFFSPLFSSFSPFVLSFFMYFVLSFPSLFFAFLCSLFVYFLVFFLSTTFSFCFPPFLLCDLPLFFLCIHPSWPSTFEPLSMVLWVLTKRTRLRI